jgi:hypothetical protein
VWMQSQIASAGESPVRVYADLYATLALVRGPSGKL